VDENQPFTIHLGALWSRETIRSIETHDFEIRDMVARDGYYSRLRGCFASCKVYNTGQYYASSHSVVPTNRVSPDRYSKILAALAMIGTSVVVSFEQTQGVKYLLLTALSLSYKIRIGNSWR